MADDPRMDTRDGALLNPEGRLVFFGGRCVLCHDLEQAKALSAELLAAQEMREVLRELQWSRDPEYPECPECYRDKERGHEPDCRLARLIGAPTFVACKNPRCEGGRISTTESITRCPDCNPKDHL